MSDTGDFELRKRPNVGRNEAEKAQQGEHPAAKHPSSELPDYAIKVLCKIDAKTGKTELESEANLKILVKLLKTNGFIVTARPDSNTNYMILLVTLEDKVFRELVDASIKTDKIFNVEVIDRDAVSIAERLRLIYYKLSLPKSKGGCGVQKGKFNVVDFLPVKNLNNLKEESALNLKQLGKCFKKLARDSNVAFLKENLGIKYAIYYKFVQAYVSSVGALSVFGVLSWYFLGNFSVIYTLINSFIGFTCYLCLYASEKKTRKDWKLNNVNKTEVVIVDEPYLLPTWKVLLRKFSFIPVTIVCSILLFVGQFLCFLLEIFITEIYQGPFQSILALVPTVIVCLLVPIGTMVYSLIASKYLDFESNPTNEKRDASMNEKMFTFNCLAAYSPLLITSYIYLPLGYLLNPYLETIKAIVLNFQNVHSYIPNIPTLEEQYRVNNLRLSTQIFYFMVTNQIVGTVTEFGLPLVVSKVMSLGFVAKLLGTVKSTKEIDLQKLDKADEHEYLELVRNEFTKPVVSIDDDYRQHVIQYGFLMLFGSIWSLSSLVCFFFGLVQQEGDYLKYIKLSKSNIPNRCEGSNPWLKFMKVLLILGSFISMSITLMFGNGEIMSYVEKSSVSNNLFNILSGSIFSLVLIVVLVLCSEKVIDSIYEVNSVDEIEKEKRVSSLYSGVEHETVSTNEVETIFQQISEIQATF